jgi:uncharacterized membrane protein YdjX (TVP38/TMEM64 family)
MDVAVLDPNRALRNARILAVLVVATLLIVAQRLGVFEQFAAPERVKQTLVDLGPWGYLAFIGAYALLHPFGMPGTVFVFAAPLIWPWPIAYALSMTGTMAGSVVGFSFSRFVARDWIAKIIPARFKKYDEAVAKRGFVTVFLLRLILWMPPLLHAFFGISKVRFWTHFWGSFFGYLLPLFLVSYFGERLWEAARTAPHEVWFTIGAAVVIAVIGWWLVRRRRTA